MFSVLCTVCFLIINQVISTDAGTSCQRLSTKESTKKLHLLKNLLQKHKLQCKLTEISKSLIVKTTTSVPETSRSPEKICTENIGNETPLPLSHKFANTWMLEEGSGHMARACGNRYIFITTLMKADKAKEICKSLNMNLASIDGFQNLLCLARYWNYNLKMLKHATFWTSGKLMGSKYVWESKNNELVDKDIFTPVHLGDADCLTVLLGIRNITVVTGAQPAKCYDMNYVLCQVADKKAPTTPEPTTEDPACYLPNCPQLNCMIDRLDDTKDYVAENFRTLGSECSKKKSYFLSKIEVPFAEAQSLCCKANFSGVSFKDQNEAVCVRNVLTKVFSNESSFRVWTSGTSQDCSKKWIWCSTGEEMTKKYSLWAYTQPDNKNDFERCIALGRHVKLTHGLFDQYCSNLYPVLCEKYN